MSDKTKAELVRDNARLKRTVRELEQVLRIRKGKSLITRLKSAFRAFLKELSEV